MSRPKLDLEEEIVSIKEIEKKPDVKKEEASGREEALKREVKSHGTKQIAAQIVDLEILQKVESVQKPNK